MTPIEITSPDDPRVSIFTSLTDAELRNRLDPSSGLFIAESPKVIRVALSAGYEPVALLCEAKHLSGDAVDIVKQCSDVTVYTGSRETLASLTGYTLTRGVLCAMRRPAPLTVERAVSSARRVAVLDGICDSTNVGAIFRSAAALGIDAVLLAGGACDPFNRRVIRVSMGSVFLIPWAFIGDYQNVLNSYGFATVAFALRNDSIALDSPLLAEIPRIAIVLGTEGDGLSPDNIAAADHVVRIPMHHGVDSLNVGAAAAIAFYELTRNKSSIK